MAANVQELYGVVSHGAPPLAQEQDKLITAHHLRLPGGHCPVACFPRQQRNNEGDLGTVLRVGGRLKGEHNLTLGQEHSALSGLTLIMRKVVDSGFEGTARGQWGRLVTMAVMEATAQISNLGSKILNGVHGSGQLLFVSAQHGSLHLDCGMNGCLFRRVHVGQIILSGGTEDPKVMAGNRSNLLIIIEHRQSAEQVSG